MKSLKYCAKFCSHLGQGMCSAASIRFSNVSMTTDLSSFGAKQAQSLDTASSCLCMGFYEDKMFIHLLIVKILSPLGVLSPLCCPVPSWGSHSRRWTIEKQSQKTVTNNSDYRVWQGLWGVTENVGERWKKWPVLSSLPHPIHPVSGGLQK